jgi:hypothetical protein
MKPTGHFISLGSGGSLQIQIIWRNKDLSKLRIPHFILQKSMKLESQGPVFPLLVKEGKPYFCRGVVMQNQRLTRISHATLYMLGML